MSTHTHTKLHARPGLHSLHIGDDVHAVAADGTVQVPNVHVELALGLGCSRTPVAPEIEAANAANILDLRIQDLEERLAIVEASVAASGTKKR